MKKLFVLLGVFCALCFVACSNFQLAGGDMGVVSLSIGDNLAREIRSAAASRNVADGTYTLTASIRGEYSDSQTVAVANGNYSGVTFTFEDVPVGKRIILDLTAKADGNYIWYGNSGKHMVVSGINNLNVAVGRVSGVLMWKSTENGGKIAPYGNYESKTSLLTKESPYPVWCFDNAGNIYWYAEGENGVQCYNLQSDKSYTRGDYYYPPVSALSYDNSANILYGIGDGGALKYWQKTGGGSQDILLDGGSGLFSISDLGFTVHNNIVYCATYEPNALGVVKLSSYKLEDASDGSKTATPLLVNTFTLREEFGSNPPTSQMIYQDGALYLMVSGVKDSSPTLVSSVGAVVKIDPTTLRLDANFGQGGYLGLSTERKVPYQDWSGKNQLCSVYAASSPTEKVFSNPLGFVAIMPKKLVIADAGCIVYDEIASPGDYPRLRGAVVSRIVTVDLETQSLGFENLNPEQYYWTGNPLGSSVDISPDTSSSSF